MRQTWCRIGDWAVTSILTVFGSEAGLMAGRFGSSVQRQNSLGRNATVERAHLSADSKSGPA